MTPHLVSGILYAAATVLAGLAIFLRSRRGAAPTTVMSIDVALAAAGLVVHIAGLGAVTYYGRDDFVLAVPFAAVAIILGLALTWARLRGRRVAPAPFAIHLGLLTVATVLTFREVAQVY